MAEADLFLYIGYNLEGFVTKAKPILEDEGVKTIAVGESVAFDEPTMKTLMLKRNIMPMMVTTTVMLTHIFG